VSIELMCRKIGMTQVFADSGECIPVTVLEAGPNVVVQKKNDAKDGYTALQLGFEERREKLVSKGELGHTKAAGVEPQHYLVESRIASEEAEQYEVGQKIDCSIFEQGSLVDAIGTSKGCGFGGVVKRHGFAIKKRTHGTHEAFRHGGSIGAGATPGHVIKGMKMPGQLGNERVTVKNLEVVRVDAEKNLVYVRGGVPGHNDAIVRIRRAVNSVGQNTVGQK
jgi:large subunit ribosomal protein L3